MLLLLLLLFCDVLSWYDIDGLVQDCSISIDNTLEILQSGTKLSLYCIVCIDGLVLDGGNSSGVTTVLH